MTNKVLVLVALASSGCMIRQQLAADRFSGEMRCPQPRIVAVERPDIEPNVVDVHGCGRAARYNCFASKFGTHCIREPLDPATEARLADAPGP
jgi:hypothetical protein